MSWPLSMGPGWRLVSCPETRERDLALAHHGFGCGSSSVRPAPDLPSQVRLSAIPHRPDFLRSHVHDAVSSRARAARYARWRGARRRAGRAAERAIARGGAGRRADPPGLIPGVLPHGDLPADRARAVRGSAALADAPDDVRGGGGAGP